MVAWLLPESLTAPASDPQVGEVRAYMQPHAPDVGWEWKATRPRGRHVVPVRCTVVDTDPLTVTFTSTRVVDGSTRLWRDIDGKPFTGHSIPPGTFVVLGDTAGRLACLWSELEDWHEQRVARETQGLEASQLTARAERVRDEQQCQPVGDPTIVVDAAAFLALCSELDALRAGAARAQEVVDEWEAAEAVEQAERAAALLRGVAS